MATPIYLLERELEYARAREAYYKSTSRPIKTTVDKQPRTLAAYRPLFLKVGTAVPLLTVQASAAAITFFGLTNLGISTAATDVDGAIGKPRGFQPSFANAMVGDATPVVKRAYGGTGRRYVKYSGTTDGVAQAHYRSPICDPTATPTIAGLDTKLGAIKTAKGASIGDYGRIWLEIERYNRSIA